MTLTQDQIMILGQESEIGKHEADRQAEIEKRIAILFDDWRDQLLEKIKPQLSPKTQVKIGAFTDTTVNPALDILEDISDIYTIPPLRSFQDKTYEEIYESAEINQTMETSNLFMNALNTVILYPVWRTYGEEIKIVVDILTPNVLTVIASEADPTRPEMVFIKKRLDDRKGYTPDNTIWIAWTAEDHYMIDTESQAIPIPGNESAINPYGVLPFVFIHRQAPLDAIWNETAGSDLFELTILNGINRTYDQFSRTFNSFKQLAITGNYKQLPEAIMSTPDQAVAVEGEGVDVNILDFTMDFKSLDEQRARHIATVADQYGISLSKSTAVSEAASGRALIVQGAKYTRKRQKQIKIFERAEKELFELIKILRAKGPENTGKGNVDTSEMKIDFVEPEVYIDDNVKLDVLQKEVAGNLKSMVDAFIARNPDFANDRAGAEKALKRTIEENNKYNAMIDTPLKNALDRIEKEE